MTNFNELGTTAAENLRVRSLELRQVLLANRIHQEMEAGATLEQALRTHLPATDPAVLAQAAADITCGVADMYNGLNEEMTSEKLTEYLNRMLGSSPIDQQGKWLVNFLRCGCTANLSALDENPSWQALSTAESFSREDIDCLLTMVTDQLTDTAGFIARQEFQTMEKSLERFSEEHIEVQMGSGKIYAEAYAAALYIYPAQNKIPPYELGLSAANSVEGSHLLALYHHGKLQLTEAMPRLKAMAMKMLALAFRVWMGVDFAQVTLSLLTYLSITNPVVLFLVPLALGTMVFAEFSQQDAIDVLEDIWETIKSIVSGVIRFFTGAPAASAEETKTVCAEEEIVLADEETIFEQVPPSPVTV